MKKFAVSYDIINFSYEIESVSYERPWISHERKGRPDRTALKAENR